MDNSNSYSWSELNRIVEGQCGIYAWYFSPMISTCDVEDLKRKLESLNNSEKHECVRNFLMNNLFDYFKESPYSAKLNAPLKPAYNGFLHHNQKISATLVDKIVDDPDRLTVIKKLLSHTVPHFASPLYIGMSNCLSTRINRHKSLIEKFSSQRETKIFDTEKEADLLGDQSFASEVVNRKIPSSKLNVWILPVPMIETRNEEYKDLENILNRIYFPLFGKN